MKKYLLPVVGLTLLTSLYRPALSQSVDPSFVPGGIYKPGTIFSALEQPNGQLVVAGRFTRVNGTAASTLLRLSAAGTPDAAFQQNVGAAEGAYRPRLLPNGQLLVISIGAAPIRAGGLTRASVLRLNADGTGDATFDAGSGATKNGTPVFVDDLLPLPNGQLIVVGPFDQFNGVPAKHIVRLNANGSVDATFAAGTGADQEVETAVALPNGQLLIGGFFTSYNGNAANGLARLNANGAFDATFSTDFQSYSEAINLTVQPDGKILVAGGLYTTANPGGSGLTRLLPNGATDNSFAFSYLDTYTTYSYFGDAIQLQPDGKILLLSLQSNTVQGVVRLQANGTQDLSYQAGTNRYLPYSLTRLASGRTLVGGAPLFGTLGNISQTLAQLTDSGAPVATFQSVIQAPGDVNAVARQPDGKVLAGGYFTEAGGQPAAGLARFSATGGLDASFATVARPWNEGISDLVLQPDGSVVVSAGNQVLRYLSSGQVDNSFSRYSLRGVSGRLALQPDGRLLVGDYGGLPGASLVRLLPTGAPDASFSTSSTTLKSIMALALQPDGKVVVAGEYTANGRPVTQVVVRLNSDGTQDNSFTSPAVGPASFSNLIRSLAVQPDGRLVVGGSFTSVGSATLSGVARLTPSGAPDPSFMPPMLTGTVHKVLLQPNNRILLGGSFTSAALPNNLARLLPTGGADASFAATAQPSGYVGALLVQPDGRLLVGGNFAAVGTQPVTSLVQLTATNVLAMRAPSATAAHTDVWPVPAHSVLHVAPDPAAHPLAIDLLDVLGRVVQHKALTNGTATLPVEELNAGTYVVRVTYAEGVVSRPVVIH